MESTVSIAANETIDQNDLVVHNWRVAQLVRLGIPALLAETAADHVDWHQVAKLIQRGCPPLLALRIVR
jgi:predicted component of type VI protein secretion system